MPMSHTSTVSLWWYSYSNIQQHLFLYQLCICIVLSGYHIQQLYYADKTQYQHERVSAPIICTSEYVVIRMLIGTAQCLQANFKYIDYLNHIQHNTACTANLHSATSCKTLTCKQIQKKNANSRQNVHTSRGVDSSIGRRVQMSVINLS